MEKGLCYGALVVGVLSAAVFLADLAAGVPFGGGGTFQLGDIFGLLAGLIVAYLGFNASRDLK